MTKNTEKFISEFMAYVKARDPFQSEFHQAVHEVAESLAPFLVDNPRYLKAKILERIVEPERVIQFRVPWVDDKGNVFFSRGQIPETRSFYFDVDKQEEHMLVDLPYRHPEFRMIEGFRLLVFENCPSQQSTIKIAKLDEI